MIPTLKLLHDRCAEVGDCLIWQQATTAGGYPIISLSSTQRGVSVRRLAWELGCGEKIAHGRYIFSTCGCCACIAQGCLEIGTKSDYMRNANRFGAYSTMALRIARARSQQSRSTLDWNKVSAMRTARAGGALLTELAAQYNISPDSVSKISRGLSWRESMANSSVFQMAA